MAGRSTKKSTTSRSRDRSPSRTLAAIVILLTVLGLGAARFGLGPSRGDGAGPVDGPGGGAATDGAESATRYQPLVMAPPLLREAPDLVGLDGWINSGALGLDSYGDQVRVVQFWTFGCRNCKNSLPHLQTIYNQWQPRGLEIIGVHSPEFDYERDINAVATAAAELGVNWPIALDPDKQSFRLWQGDRRFWPRTYVVDQRGMIRYDHIGEGDYDQLEATVAYLIENGP